MVSEGTFGDYVTALVQGNRRRCQEILRECLRQSTPAKSIYLDLIQASLYEVGARWERTEISVATEHLATSITEGLLNLIFTTLEPAASVGRSVVVAGLSPDLHQIGSRIIADMFEAKGWDSHYVGGNTKTQQLLDILAEKRPDFVALSMTINFNVGSLEQVIEAVRRTHPGLEIIIGGQALRGIGDSLASRHSRLTYMRSIDELDALLGGANAGKSFLGREEPAADLP